MQRKGLSMIELLIGVAIVTVLSVVVILVINPAQLLKEGRDGQRASDMETLTHAASLYRNDLSLSMGSSYVEYISIPDPSATTTAGDQCQGLGLPALASAWSYHCAASSTYRNVDGTGWLPLAFTSQTGGSNISALPVDPVNQTSSGLYYAYMTDGSNFEFTSQFESSKALSKESSDGGRYASLYEVGSSLALTPGPQQKVLQAKGNSPASQSTSNSITFATTTGQGNLLVVFVAYGNQPSYIPSVPVTATDTAGNTFTSIVPQTYVLDGNALDYDWMTALVATNVASTTNDKVKITFGTSTALWNEAIIAELSGVTALDTYAIAHGNTNPALSGTSTTNAPDLILGYIQGANNNGWQTGTGFTLDATIPTVNDILEHQVQTSAGGASVNASDAGNAYFGWGALMTAFKW